MTDNESIAAASILAENASELRRSFRAAAPFRHAVLDSFLDPRLFSELTAELGRLKLSPRGPGYEWRRIERSIRRLGPACGIVEDRLRAPELLAWMRTVVGEPGLVLSPGTCGGLFRDGHGQELEPHLDVNCTMTGLRRRATLILYVHPLWQRRWGGALELFSDPSLPAAKEIEPAPNRAVLLASHESSWHGVSAIDLPPAARAVGRRALIVNFYGPGRSPRRLTTWMPRPAPARLRGGADLTPEDWTTVRRLFARRLERLRELRVLELAAAPESRPQPLPEPPAPLQAGRAPSAAATREARAALDALDAELRRLYRLEYAYRLRLDRRGAAR